MYKRLTVNVIKIKLNVINRTNRKCSDERSTLNVIILIPQWRNTGLKSLVCANGSACGTMLDSSSRVLSSVI